MYACGRACVPERTCLYVLHHALRFSVEPPAMIPIEALEMAGNVMLKASEREAEKEELIHEESLREQFMENVRNDQVSLMIMLLCQV